MCLIDIQSFKEPTQGETVNFTDFLLVGGPSETILLQLFLPEAKSVSGPIEHFDDLSGATAKYKQISASQITVQLVFDQHGQSVYRLTHICRTKTKKNARLPTEPPHHAPLMAESTHLTRLGSLFL